MEYIWQLLEWPPLVWGARFFAGFYVVAVWLVIMGSQL